MSIFREISVIISLLHVLILFAFLFESRYDRRKTLLMTLLFMGPLVILNGILYVWMGPEKAAQGILITCTIPSLVFFYMLAKKRDGRFFFTFCLADTVSYWIIFVTSILDFYLFQNRFVFMLVSRVVLFPLIELLVWRYLRKIYLQIQQTIQRGWWNFAGIAMLYYILMVIMSSVPNVFSERPQDLPAICLVLILMPLLYGNIFYTLSHQLKLFRAEEERRILHTQTSMLVQQTEQVRQAEEKMRIYRHDLRHQLRTTAELLEKGHLKQAQEYIAAADGALDEIAAPRWCSDPILDAVFGSYIRQAEAAGIRTDIQLGISGNLPVNSAELSTVFANAFENAINACMAVPVPQRFIRCKCLAEPQFMFQISNSFAGEVTFDASGRPVARSAEHGIGTRSISAFCEKHNAHCSYKAENNIFTLRIMIM